MDTTNKTPGNQCQPPVWPPTTDGFVEMKLLVIAATGNLGKAIVNAALRDGHAVSVLVRDGRRRRVAPLRGRGPGVPRRRRGVGQEGREEQVQQGPGRVQGRRRDVLLRALHDDAHRLPLRLSTQLTPSAPVCSPREERLQRVDDQAIRSAVERVVVAAVRECHEVGRGQ